MKVKLELFDYIKLIQKSWEKSALMLLEVLNGRYIATFQMDSD